MSKSSPESEENVLEVGLDLLARRHSDQPDGHEGAVSVPLAALEAAVDVGHRLGEVPGHEALLVGGGQAGQEADERVLNVRVLAELRVLCDAEHALADLVEFLLKNFLASCWQTFLNCPKT